VVEEDGYKKCHNTIVTYSCQCKCSYQKATRAGEIEEDIDEVLGQIGAKDTLSSSYQSALPTLLAYAKQHHVNYLIFRGGNTVGFFG